MTTLSVLALVGCGGSDDPATSTPKALLHEVSAAAKARDYAALCNLMSSARREAAARDADSCEAAVAVDDGAGFDDVAKLHSARVRQRGESRADARVTSGDVRVTAELIREGGQWRLHELQNVGFSGP